jgi:hypothetical protein
MDKNEDKNDKDKEVNVNLIDSVLRDLKKSESESVKAKIKGKLQTKLEHERAIKQIDVEIQKIIDDFTTGV